LKELEDQFNPNQTIQDEPPQIHLFHKPTPIHELTKIPKTIISTNTNTTNLPSIYIKRDDTTGEPALSGNKIRKLEYLLADALLQKSTCM